MKAIVVREFGPPSVMRLEDVDDPRAGPGEVVVRVHAVSVNRTRRIDRSSITLKGTETHVRFVRD